MQPLTLRIGKWVIEPYSSVITAVLHSVGMKHRSLASASENACAWSGERFLFERAVVQGRWNYCLENVVFSFVVHVLLCVVMWTSLNLSRIASFKRSWELLLEVSTWLYVLSITLDWMNKKNCEAKRIFHYSRNIEVENISNDFIKKIQVLSFVL